MPRIDTMNYLGTKKIRLIEPNQADGGHASFNSAVIQMIAIFAAHLELEICVTCSKTHRKRLEETLPVDLPLSWSEIPVIDNYSRKFIKKLFQEVWNIIRVLWAAKADKSTVVILSTLPNALAAILFLRPFFQNVDLHIFLHSEVEAIFIKEKQSIKKLGFWASLALKRLYRGAWPKLYVLGSGIRSRLLAQLPQLKHLRNISAIEHPYIFQHSIADNRRADRPLRIGFVGTGRAVKGIRQFCQLANELADEATANRVEFVLIGGAERLHPQPDFTNVTVLASNASGLPTDQYFRAISELDSAVFLYQYDYRLTASGAAFDVIDHGIEILSLNNHYLKDLSINDPEGGIKFFSRIDEIANLLRQRISAGSRPQRYNYPRIRSLHHDLAAVVLRQKILGA
jgi:hypothetical protein